MARSRTPMLVLFALLVAAIAPTANAQTHSCGDIKLIFKNPDLQPGADGFIHAQGQFFAQFQAIGAGADAIKVFGFSFGPQTADADESVCAAPAWVTGAYLPNYRADSDPTDGFFIPIKTPLVPDGTYAAAVHAYDGAGKELARFWAKAIVDNCDPAATPAQEKCDTDAAQMMKHDKTAPWPIVLPGDGQVLEGHKFTIEFGEELANHTVLLNGKDITGEMVPWDGRLWDADYTPDYGPYGVGGELPHCQAPAPVQSCEKYGPSFEWKGRDLVDTDVLRVEATDLAGNHAVKDIHIGSSVAGGAVTQDVPILSYTVDHTEMPAANGASAIFAFKISNNGAGVGHPFAEATVPEGWTYEWQPVHVVVNPGETKSQELVVTVPSDAPHGIHAVNATLKYDSAGTQKVLAQSLNVLVGGASGAPASTGSTSSKSTSKSSPAIGAEVAMLVALCTVAARGRAPRNKD